jgi:hypothetical protein
MEIAASALAPEKFVPTWKGNRDLPEAEQITVMIRFPTTEEWEPFKASRFEDLDAIAIVKTFVVSVSGLTIAGEEVTTAEELVAQRRNVVSALVAEILLYIVLGTDMTEKKEKN